MSAELESFVTMLEDLFRKTKAEKIDIKDLRRKLSRLNNVDIDAVLRFQAGIEYVEKYTKELPEVEKVAEKKLNEAVDAVRDYLKLHRSLYNFQLGVEGLINLRTDGIKSVATTTEVKPASIKNPKVSDEELTGFLNKQLAHGSAGFYQLVKGLMKSGKIGRNGASGRILRYVKSSPDYFLSAEPYRVWKKDAIPSHLLEKGYVPFDDNLFVSKEWLNNINKIGDIPLDKVVSNLVDKSGKNLDAIPTEINSIVPQYFKIVFGVVYRYNENTRSFVYEGKLKKGIH